MTRTTVNVKHLLPISRSKAAEIAAAAGRFSSMITLEREGVVLNLKSMIGLLSQSIPQDGEMVLVVVGEDEAEASRGMQLALEV